MNTFQIDYNDGDFFITGFNGTLADATAYYLGTSFVTHEDDDTGFETVKTVVKVNQLD